MRTGSCPTSSMQLSSRECYIIMGCNDLISLILISLLWRHHGRDNVSNHQPHDCLFNRLIRRRSKKTSKLRVTGLCAGNSPGTGEFPAQMASNAENVSIWWRHHGKFNWISRSFDDIYNNAWGIVNYDFWVTSHTICQWLSRVTKSRVKIIGKPHHEWLQNRYSRNECIILFLHAILCPEHTIPLKQLSITDFAIVAKDGLFWLSIVTSPQLICDVMRAWGTGIVTSFSSIVLARVIWRKGDLR